MNREFAFYCPELDCIVIQLIVSECLIGFEWKFTLDDINPHSGIFDQDITNPNLLLMPLGEV